MYDFAHLHVASSFSLRYGTAAPAALAARAAELGMPVLALTDRDGLYGAFKHAQACAAAGIAPVLGADLPLGAGRGTVLAVGRTGWASLCRLVSAMNAGPVNAYPVKAGHVAAGPAGRRPLTPDLIAAYREGLVLMIGADSDAGRALAAGRPGQAIAALRRWQACAEAVIEITDHRGKGDTARARNLLRFARQTGTTAVLTNAVRYLVPSDSPVAQVLDAVRHNSPLGTPALAPHNGQAHLAGPAEMAARAAAIADGAGDAGRLLDDTASLARRCTLDPARDLGIGVRHLPETADNPLGRDASDLAAACERALRAYRGDERQAAGRLVRELEIITATGLSSYFLTVADVARRIKARGIRCAIRGSGAGSLVNHLLGISVVDPLEHGLLMERFLAHTRETMPDIDLDVESARRIEAYRVILAAYGEGRCATVSMIQTYRARSAIRDVAAAFGLPQDEIGKIATAFPQIRAAHIGAALTELPELRGSQLTIPQLRGIFRAAERLDGLPRHVAMHPCGLLLSDDTLLDRTAVGRSAQHDLPLSHLDKDDSEIAGVIKLDVLGVRMQSAMAYTLTQIPGKRPDLDRIPRDDEPTFELIRKARTIGCFQIESPGQRELVTKVAPREMTDLITEISLFRPGPVNSDMITPYLATRHGRLPPRYPHEDLREALKETGGVVIFHEQVMHIIDVMTGCGLAEADRIRRRLSAGQPEQWFRTRAAARGYAEPVISSVWEVLAAFGGFGFCKAHAAAFAVPVYQSAWLKRHHPAAFYAGVLTHDPGMYPKRVIVHDARLGGIEVLGPDVNASAGGWLATVSGITASGSLRTSLREVKGISDAEVGRIVAGQPYRSLRDFTERAMVSRPVTEHLIMTGAFDSLYAAEPIRPTRRDLLARLGVLNSAAPGHAGATAYAATLDFGEETGASDGLADMVPAGQLRDLNQAERTQAELAILGFDVSTHVLAHYDDLLAGLGVVRSPELALRSHGETVLVAGVKVATQTPAIRSGRRIIFASLDDAAGLVDLAFFESAQDRCAATLAGSWLLLVRGRVRHAYAAGGRAGPAGPAAVTVNAIDCWDLAELDQLLAARGIAAVRAAVAVPSNPGSRAPDRPAAAPAKPLVYANGFTLSPYAETGTPGQRSMATGTLAAGLEPITLRPGS